MPPDRRAVNHACPRRFEQRRQGSNTFAVEAYPRSLDLDVILPACNRFKRIANADRDASEAQAHVEVKPVTLGWINAHIDIEAVFSHVDGTHILRNVPHEAIERDSPWRYSAHQRTTTDSPSRRTVPTSDTSGRA